MLKPPSNFPRSIIAVAVTAFLAIGVNVFGAIVFLKIFGTVITSAFAAYGVFNDYKEDDPTRPGKKIVTSAGRISVIGGVVAALLTITATSTEAVYAKLDAEGAKRKAEEAETRTRIILAQMNATVTALDRLAHPFVPKFVNLTFDFETTNDVFKKWLRRVYSDIQRKSKQSSEKLEESTGVLKLIAQRDGRELVLYRIPSSSSLSPSYGYQSKKKLLDIGTNTFYGDSDGLHMLSHPNVEVMIFSQRPRSRSEDPLYRQGFFVGNGRSEINEIDLYPGDQIMSQRLELGIRGEMARAPDFLGMSQLEGKWIVIDYLGVIAKPKLTNFELHFDANETRSIKMGTRDFAADPNLSGSNYFSFVGRISTKDIVQADW